MQGVRKRGQKDTIVANNSEDEEKNTAIKHTKSPSISWTIATYFVAIVVGSILVGAVFYAHYYTHLPPPKSSAVAPDIFSEGRAREHAVTLSEKIGKRIVGSKANERLAVGYILSQVQKLKEYTDNLRQQGRDDVPLIEISVEKSSGGHVFSILGFVTINMYSNITNVIARISDGKDSMKSAVLVNSHFDTTIGTQGAADDAVPTGIMLEMLHNLAHSKPLKHPVIFLWNGAEESLQEGSHAFITEHPWAPSCRLVVNLEACGTGGPELLFQVGSTEILYEFAKTAPYPHGTALAADIFATGVIQSDTDYRIFRDYGGVVGVDLAYYRESYVYHTTLDSMDRVQIGAIQHMGENAFAITKALASSDFLDKPLTKTKYVYFDIFGKYMVAYSMDLGQLLHFSAVLVFIATGWLSRSFRSSITNIVSSFWNTMMCFFAGIVVCAIVGLLMHLIGAPLKYFANPFVTVILYGMPTLIAMLYLQKNYAESNLRKTTLSQLEWNGLIGVVTFHVAFLILSTVAKLGSSFIFFWQTVAWLLALWINCLLSSPSRGTLGFTYVIGLLATLQTLDATMGVLDTFIPLAGRLANYVLTDVIVGLVAGLYFSLMLLPVIPVAHKAGNHATALKGFMALFVIGFVVVLATIPTYTSERPKRLFVQHTHFAQAPGYTAPEYSSILISTPDPFSIETTLRDTTLQGHRAAKYDDLKHPEVWDSVYPFSNALVGTTMSYPAKPYPKLSIATLEVLSSLYDPTRDVRTLHLQVNYNGTEWSTIRFKEELVAWSLVGQEPPKENKLIVIRHVGDYGITKWDVTLSFKGKHKIPFVVGGVDFAESEDMKQLSQQLPEWTISSSFVASYAYYEV